MLAAAPSVSAFGRSTSPKFALLKGEETKRALVSPPASAASVGGSPGGAGEEVLAIEALGDE